MNVRQAVEHPNSISVLGTPLLHAPPDHASIRCSVCRVAVAPQDAFAQARLAATAVREALAALGVQEVRSSRISLALRARWDREAGRDVHLGYAATLSFHVVVR